MLSPKEFLNRQVFDYLFFFLLPLLWTRYNWNNRAMYMVIRHNLTQPQTTRVLICTHWYFKLPRVYERVPICRSPPFAQKDNVFNWVHFAVINMNIDRDRTDSRVWALGNKRGCGIAQRAAARFTVSSIARRIGHFRADVIFETRGRLEIEYVSELWFFTNFQ